MALMSAPLNPPAGYALGSSIIEEKDSGSGFEFTRRKKWPQLLLQELCGAALFCLKPVPAGDGRNNGSPGWKVIYASPSTIDMIGQKPSDLEGRDFFEIVFAPDHTQLQNLFKSLITPHPPLPHQSSSSTETSTPGSIPPNPALLSTNMPHSLGKSQTTYARIISSDIPPRKKSSSSESGGTIGEGSGSGSNTPNTKRRGGGPGIWEIRAHATGLDPNGSGLGGINGMNGVNASNGGGGNYGLGGPGTMSLGMGDKYKGKAVWVMGRKVGGGDVDGVGESSAQTLDSFLELKLENERMRAELKELQLDMDDPQDIYNDHNQASYDPSPETSSPAESISDDSDYASSSGAPPAPTAGPSNTTTTTSATSKSAAGLLEKKKAGRPKVDKSDRDKKRAKKGGAGVSGKAGTGGTGGEQGEGMHVCVTCGRTDSPEWRKGPLGPKTLCNACGLRWAKRNSTQPTRKERKAQQEAKKQQQQQQQ